MQQGQGLRASLGGASWGRRWELVSLQVDSDSGLRVGSCPGPGGGLSLKGSGGSWVWRWATPPGGAVQKFPRKSRATQCLGGEWSYGMNPRRVTSPMLLTQGDRP